MMKKIGREEYGKAVIAAIRLARQGGTTGGSIAAQALLSAYNGGEFQLSVAGLSGLDRENYEIVVTVIRGRYDTGIEPHSLVKNGSAVFRELWSQWQGLNVAERGKTTCTACNGLGRMYRDDDDEIGRECSRCGGAGRVCGCRNEKF